METKAEIRSRIRNELAQLDPKTKQKWDQVLCKKVLQYLKDHRVKVLHTYIPMAQEIDIKPVIEYCWKKDIDVVVPKMEAGKQLSHHLLESFEELETNRHGVIEPGIPKPYSEAYDLILVPGLAFDENDNRLGYGGGYYDRFLKKEDHSLALAYPFMLLKGLPVEDHDIALTKIIGIS